MSVYEQAKQHVIEHGAGPAHPSVRRKGIIAQQALAEKKARLGEKKIIVFDLLAYALFAIMAIGAGFVFG